MDYLLQNKIAGLLDLSGKFDPHPRDEPLNCSTGLICYLQGRCFEHGYHVKPKLDLALKYYLAGTLIYGDPLCAERITLVGKMSKAAQNACNLIVSALMQPTYGQVARIKSNPSIQYEEGTKELSQKLPEVGDIIPITQIILQSFVAMENEPKQKAYEQLMQKLIEDYKNEKSLKLSLQLLCMETQNEDKLITQLIGANWQQPQFLRLLKVININLRILSMCIQDSFIFRSQRNLFWETISLLKIKKIQRSQEMIQLIQSTIKDLYAAPALSAFPQHKVMVIRKMSKIVNKDSPAKAIEIAQKESQYAKSPLMYYYLGRLLKSTTDCQLCKCDKLLKLEQNIYTSFVYKYYAIKSELNHLDHNNKKITTKFVDQVGQLYDQNQKSFSYVRTLQFIKFRLNLDNLKQQLKQRLDFIDNAERERQRFLEQVLADRQQMFRSRSKSPIEASQGSTMSILKTGPKLRMQPTRSLGRSYKFLLDVTPKKQPIQFDSFHNLTFIDLYSYEAHFIRKANRDGEVYSIEINQHMFSMKQYPFLFWSQIEKFLHQQDKYEILDHPNLGKIIAYSTQDVKLDITRKTATLCLVYERYEVNLQEYLQLNSLDLQGKVELMVKIADTVLYLHNNQIVCGNIKPANVLFLSFEPYLLDWDLQNFEQLETDGHGFLAPELQENFHRIDEIELQPPCDVWSLGILFLYILYNSFMKIPELTESSERSTLSEDSASLVPSLKLSQLSTTLNVYKTERLKLDFSEIMVQCKSEDFQRVNTIRELVEEMIVRDPLERAKLMDITLRLYELFDSW